MLKQNLSRRKRKSIALLLVVFLMASLNSCTKGEIDLPGNNSKEIVATFNTTINSPINSPTTRASDTKWDSGDAIGIFAITSGDPLSENSIYNNYNNIKYVCKFEGDTPNFQATNEVIKFPGSKQELDFIAYYPYSNNGVIEITESEEVSELGLDSDFTLKIDVADQLPQSKIDVMYARATKQNRENPNVDLSFKHSLSQLVLTVSAEEGIELEGSTFCISNTITEGSMKLEDGVVTPATDVSDDTITMETTYDSSKNIITAKAILIPGWDLSKAKILIKTSNGYNYSWKSGEFALKPNIRRGYKLKLTPNTVEMINDGFTIEGWQDESDESIEEILPDNSTGDDSDVDDDNVDGTGDGTADNPYSVARAIKSKVSTEVWVQGYIRGWAESGGIDQFKFHGEKSTKDLSKLNIILADDSDETEVSKMMPIKFKTDNAAQKNLNLKDNYDEIINHKVKVQCILGKAYGVSGGTDILDYDII